MKTIRLFIAAFLTGAFTGSVIAYFFLQQPGTSTDEVKTTQISGEKITHNSFDFSGKSLKFKTIAEGKGEAATEIPKTLIPEANDWINRVHSITLSYGYKFDSSGIDPYIGVMYLYRFGRFSIGGGADASTDFIGIKASAGVCW